MATPWRIRDRATFIRLRRGQRARSGPVTLTWTPAAGDERPRVAYAVGRSVGPAVVRNRVRRRLRAAVAEVAADLPPGAYLVGAREAAARSNYQELRSSVASVLEAPRRSPAAPAGRPR